jgi:hypothetical protein
MPSVCRSQTRGRVGRDPKAHNSCWHRRSPEPTRVANCQEPRGNRYSLGSTNLPSANDEDRLLVWLSQRAIRDPSGTAFYLPTQVGDELDVALIR